MKFDRSDHPISQTAMRVFFACFIVGMGLATVFFSRNHVLRSRTFCVVLSVWALLTICSIITYFRPRGLPAFFTSTAYVGVFLVGGVFFVGARMQSLQGRWGAVAVWGILILWLLRGIQLARRAHLEARDLEAGAGKPEASPPRPGAGS